ncbi:MAG: tRNA1(Val) (adenine(37)-N6)-methyltransferase [Thermodesulfobacteriota bacterium]
MEKIGPYTFKEGGLDEITSDTLLLADFIPSLSASHNVIDIGSGAGAIPLLLASRNPGVKITAVEILRERADAARSNVEANGLSGRVTVINADYRGLAEKYPAGAFTHVVTNPPFVKQGSGRVSPVFERRVARSEAFGGLTDLIRLSSHLAGGRGGMYMVFTAERVTELLGALKDAGLAAVRIKFVHPCKGAPACRVLVEARQGLFEESGAVEEPIYLR